MLRRIPRRAAIKQLKAEESFGFSFSLILVFFAFRFISAVFVKTSSKRNKGSVPRDKAFIYGQFSFFLPISVRAPTRPAIP